MNWINRAIKQEEIDRELFRSFERRQVVDQCWRKEAGQWVIRRDPFIDQWSEADYAFLVTCLRHTIAEGGVVFGAFCEGKLKGFASVEGLPLGSRNQYLDLTSLHVSEELRGRGWVAACLPWRRTGPDAGGRRSCTSPVTLQWRPRPSTGPWAAGKRRSPTWSMWKKNPLTASWNIN